MNYKTVFNEQLKRVKELLHDANLGYLWEKISTSRNQKEFESNLMYAQKALTDDATASVAAGRQIPNTLGGITTEAVAPMEEKRMPIIDSSVVLERSVGQMTAAVNKLRDDMLTGRLSANVWVDSQKLSLATDRATRFRNGDGVNDTLVAT